ncbi:MAG TPA: AAA family ATPase, partial [Spirochaetota bacterium]|nr:AAA family ATPase [Spirochaetota bacterium]
LPLTKIDNRLELHHYVYDYIKSKLIVDNSFLFDESQKTIFALVGPTGVGKTTTITKIAANGVKEKLKVELITIDGFRIGAKYQLEKYAEIMETPMRSVEENLELQKIVTLTDANLVLIDTIGRSQKDELNLVKMKQILNIKNYNVYFALAVSATTKACDIEKIFKSFDIFDYKSVVITKIDESENIGAIISESVSRKKAILYFTNGQRVPNDIEKATTSNLMSKIKGLEMEVVLQNSRY